MSELGTPATRILDAERGPIAERIFEDYATRRFTKQEVLQRATAPGLIASDVWRTRIQILIFKYRSNLTACASSAKCMNSSTRQGHRRCEQRWTPFADGDLQSRFEKPFA